MADNVASIIMITITVVIGFAAE